MANVDAAKVIVIAKPKSIATSTKDTTFTVLVTYTVDEALVGTKTPEVVVEESCDTGSPTLQESGYPGVARYCSGTHELPGLTSDGLVGTSAAALTLVEDKSVVDGKPVMKLVRGSAWGPCPDEAALLKKRPALKGLVAKVQAVNAKTTFGLPAPPAKPAASASALPPPSVSASVTATPTAPPPAPATSAPPPPQKSGGCSYSSGSEGNAGLMSTWLLVGVAILTVRRNRRD